MAKRSSEDITIHGVVVGICIAVVYCLLMSALGVIRWGAA